LSRAQARKTQRVRLDGAWRDGLLTELLARDRA